MCACCILYSPVYPNGHTAAVLYRTWYLLCDPIKIQQKKTQIFVTVAFSSLVRCPTKKGESAIQRPRSADAAIATPLPRPLLLYSLIKRYTYSSSSPMTSYEGLRQFLQKQSSDGVSLYHHLANVLLKVSASTLTFPPSFGGENHLCLLYTSPSPRDLSTSRMPSSA